jgi:hypothetical protein
MISDTAAQILRDRGYAACLFSRAGNYIALPATTREEAEAMLSDGSVDADDDCIIVGV